MRLGLVLLFAVACASAQKGGPAPVATPPTRSVGDAATYNHLGITANSLVVYGNVTFPNGSPPDQLVMIERVCGGLTQAGGFADSKGRFSFDLGVLNHNLGPGSMIDNLSSTQLAGNWVTAESLAKCIARASLSGYRSGTLPLAKVSAQKTALGTIVLKPFGSEEAPSLSATESGVPKSARKDFEKALDAAAHAKWQEAIDSFQKAATTYPKYAAAWLGLGQLQAGSGNTTAALQSYTQSMMADEKFAPPYIEAAQLESQAADWEKVTLHAGKAIALAPNAFPRAYLLAASAYLNLHKLSEARTNAEEGIAIDGDRQYSDLEYIEGIALMGANDEAGARKHLGTYLALAPHGPNAASAAQTLAQLPDK